ncbi:trichohyalin isoform X3 [Drosophila grimshawi]|uniref:trichohyalin isoform X3 n=2 Tax=Drosophila grimshawi TaxID=7222 RepID=UPI001C93283B|nr:trichohyalin isoform X3 [Drosophila grimshawi]
MAADQALTDVGELIFSLIIGYLGALEFAFVARQLYHWTCRHPCSNEDADAGADAHELPRLRDRLDKELKEAVEREAAAGTNVMQDGVLYSNGFRVESPEAKRAALAAELERQRRIEEETRKQLADAEHKLAEERRTAAQERAEAEAAAAAESAQKLIEAEKQREAAQREREENEERQENERKLIEAEKQREENERRMQEAEQQQREREENERQLIEAEKQREENERRLQEAEQQQREREENERKLIEAEKQREENERRMQEAEQQQREREENERKLIEAEKQREENERRMQEAEQQQRERQENERILFEAEKQREAELEENERKLQRELEENEKQLREAEAEREETQRKRELAAAAADEQDELEENERKLQEAEAEREEEQRQSEYEEADREAERLLFQSEEEQAKRDAEIVERLLAAERERKLSATESELEEEAIVLEQTRRLAASKAAMEKKQKSIEENARLFMEAEEEMVMMQQRLLQAQKEQEDAYYAGAVPVVEEPCIKKILPPRYEEPAIDEPMIVQRVKTQFGQTSAAGEEPYTRSKTLTFPGVSDEGSSVEPISTQLSSFSTQASDEQRQEPEGEDNVPDVQYTEDYLRSLDGIKSRPLVREDGSGRRRAFKKRRSSGSSNSSRESRASRDEELKMFTSLEEEELRHGAKEDYNPIKYSSEPTLRVKSQRRHKRSPAKDVKPPTDPTAALEMLGEESANPWGEGAPEHYKNTEFWKREKALSIDEEELEHEKRVSGEEVVHMDKPKASSFEEATEAQNEEAAHSLRQQRSKEEQVDKDSTESSTKATDSSRSDIKSNLIFSGEYTKAMDKDWHSGHFCCWQCDESLTGQRYVIRDDHPYCIKCYENVFANTCEECNKIIGIDSKDLSYKDKHWHEACFLCFKCNLNLVDKQFGAKADKIYCGNCYDSQFASRCDGCGEVFRAGTKKMEYKTRQWHENCFCCCVCKMAIGTKSFIPREQEIYCAGCYEEKFATRCIKCNKVITSGGVTYKNEPWHRECFTCTHCNITLAGQRFTSRDEKPYCAECFGELFAKRCTSCVKPITGIGGTRFISFEDRHWHHDCFVCASCKASLVGRGFITDGPDILCPDCAKQKLM